VILLKMIEVSSRSPGAIFYWLLCGGPAGMGLGFFKPGLPDADLISE
jgi:hypothetical protein